MKAKLLITSILASMIATSVYAAWPVVYNSTFPYTRGVRLDTDSQGNVVLLNTVANSDLSKYAIEVTKFNRFGALQWSRRMYDFYSPSAVYLDIDDSGAIYLLGGSKENRYLTIKLNSLGAKQWAYIASADGNGYSSPTEVIAIPAGGCIVTGSSLSKGNSYDAFTVRYDAAGSVLWFHQLDVVGEAEHLEDMAVNDNGDIFITGVSSGTDNGDLLIAKYRWDGLLYWVRTFDGANYDGLDYDYGRELAVDGIGGALVVGTLASTDGTKDAMVARYNSVGSRLWYKRIYQARYRSEDGGAYIRMCPDNNVVVLMQLGVGSNLATSHLIRKFDMGGETVWSRSITRTDDEGNNILGYAAGFEVSANNNIFYSARIGHTGEDVILSSKLDGTGNTLMEALYRPGTSAYPASTGYDPIYKKFFVTGTGLAADGTTAALIARY